MEESSESSTGKRWLMLLASVPVKPDYLRVKLRRRVQRIGAISLKGAVYLLPWSAERLADFQLLRDEVLADGGDAVLWSAKVVEGESDAALIARFAAERNREYLAFIAAGETFLERWEQLAAGGARQPLTRFRADRDRLFEQLAEIMQRDHLRASSREAALVMLERLAVVDVGPAPRREE